MYFEQCILLHYKVKKFSGSIFYEEQKHTFKHSIMKVTTCPYKPALKTVLAFHLGFLIYIFSSATSYSGFLTFSSVVLISNLNLTNIYEHHRNWKCISKLFYIYKIP